MGLLVFGRTSLRKIAYILCSRQESNNAHPELLSPNSRVKTGQAWLLVRASISIDVIRADRRGP